MVAKLFEPMAMTKTEVSKVIEYSGVQGFISTAIGVLTYDVECSINQSVWEVISTILDSLLSLYLLPGQNTKD